MPIDSMFRTKITFVLVCLLLQPCFGQEDNLKVPQADSAGAASNANGSGAQGSGAQGSGATFPDLAIPEDADLESIAKIIARAKQAQPRSPEQYQAMQVAIRDGSRRALTLMKGKETTPEYKQAELDTISSSVLLMTFFGEDAKKKTLEQVHDFLKGRETLSMTDVQTGMMAAAMLELQPNKRPSRDTYELLDNLLEDDEREEMQSLRINLKANVRRLSLLGEKLELEAPTMDGKEISIEDFAGKFVVIDFFATWCKPCLSEVPHLKFHLDKYKSRGLEVVGVSLDKNIEALEKYLSDADLPWPIIHDSEEDPLKTLQMKFGISQLPTVLLLNKEGTVVSLEARGAELDRLMQMLFEAPTLAPPPEAGNANQSKGRSASKSASKKS